MYMKKRNNILKEITLNDLNKPECSIWRKYKQVELKEICKEYGLKISGNKSELIKRILNRLREKHSAINIQKVFRGSMVRLFFKLKSGLKLFKNEEEYDNGLYIDKNISVNDTDFITLEPIKDISSKDLFVYKEKKNVQYLFKMSSLFDYLCIAKKVKNPYNNKKFKTNMLLRVENLIMLNKILNIIKNNEDEILLSMKDEIRFKTIDIFQKMDQLGNYTNINWFLNLSPVSTYRFVRELQDIWEYRAQIPYDVKIQICPPNGRPFFNIDIDRNSNIYSLKLNALKIINKLIDSAVDDSNKSMGALYVLSALTLVSFEAAESMPWLYESVML